MTCTLKFVGGKPHEDPVAHILSIFLFTSATLISLCTVLDIRVEDVSNLGGSWKIRDSR